MTDFGPQGAQEHDESAEYSPRRSLVPPCMPPSQVEIDLDAVTSNARDIQRLVGASCGVLTLASGAELRPAMRVTTRVAAPCSLRPGEAAGCHGEKRRAARPSRSATLPLGYSHGYPRRLLERAGVIIRGRRARRSS